MRKRKNRFFVGISAGLLTVSWLAVGCGFLTGGGLFSFLDQFGLSGNNGDQAAASKLRAELSSGTFNAQVEFDEQSDRQMVEIAVTGGTPGAVVEVSIGGVAIGSVTLDATGSGRLALSSSPAATDELPLPGEFKPPGEGDAVGVGDLSGSFDSVKRELKTRLTSGEFRADVKYDVESDEVKFRVKVRGGVPDAVLAVSAAGVAVGSITVNGDGDGKMKWTSRADHEDEQPLPANFPALAAGDTVAVGSLSGVLRADDDDDDDHGDDEDDDGDNDDSGGAELKATMESGTLNIEVKYEVEGEGAEFEVNVVGGAANGVLNITVAGVAAGSITLDAAGNGHLEYNAHADDPDEQPFPADFPTPVTGDAVSVGGLSGAFQLDADDNDNDDDANDDDDGNDNDNVGNANGNADDNTDDNVNDNN